MNLLSNDKSSIKTLSFWLYMFFALTTIIVTVFFSSGYLPALEKFFVSENLFILGIGHIAAPIFIGYRIYNAQPDSAIFKISFVISSIVGFLLFAYIIECDRNSHCNVYLFIISLVFILGAIISIFIKESGKT